MKKWIFLLALFIPLVGFGQSPGKTFRVADRTTAFGTNLPAGTMIYCVSDSTNWNVKSAGVVSTRTINTAWVAAEIEWIRTTVQNSGTRGAVNYAVAIDSTKASYQALSILAATTSYAGVITAADKTKLDGISASSGTMTAESFEIASDASSGAQVTLVNTPKDSTGVTVSLNGSELTLTTHYYCGTLSDKKVTMKIPVYKYDAVHVTYNK